MNDNLFERCKYRKNALIVYRQNLFIVKQK